MARLIVATMIVLTAIAAVLVAANRGDVKRPIQVAGCINGHCT